MNTPESREKQICRRNVQLTFPPEISVEPVVCHLVRLFDLDFTILKARITPRRSGEMTLQLVGTPLACDDGEAYLKSRGIFVSAVDQRAVHDDARCMHCGMCTALCPSHALRLNPETHLLSFFREDCSACGMCVRICPVKAMQPDAVAEDELV